MRIAIYPGSFDPITLGHLNVIKRAAASFDKLIVCVLYNSEKNPVFSPDERVEFIARAVSDLPNVVADKSRLLLADYAKEVGASVIVKGLRAVSDFDKEFQMALINRKLNPELDTIFLPATEKYMYLSSSAVRELACYGQDLSEFVPREIREEVEAKISQRMKK